MSPDELPGHLASLRRYARFLCRSEAEADLVVARTLEHLVAGGAGSGLTRLELFKALHNHWIPVDAPYERTGDRLDAALTLLTPIERAALLLCGFERFAPAQAAEILGQELTKFERCLERARAAAAVGRARRVLIVEDEVLTARVLEQVVLGMGLEPIGPAITCPQAISAAESERPDLILADIELGLDGSGIDAVREIRASLKVPVVYVTAYPDRLLDREMSADTYLVRKPLNRMALSGCIRLAMARV